MIVVIDSNIWVSLAINQQLELIASLHKNGATIVSCKNLLDELLDVLFRPKFKKYFTKTYIEKLVHLHQFVTTAFNITEIENVVSDEKDNYLFALCKISNADYFITGYKLLLTVKNYHKTAIITLTDFKNVLKLV